LQKRLFALFFSLMFVPAVIVMAIGWRTSDQQLEVLDSPGLHHSLDSSLVLARIVLGHQKQLAQQTADSLASVADPRNGDRLLAPLATLAGPGWWLWPDPAADSSLDPATIFPNFDSGQAADPVRRLLPGGPFILAAAPLKNEPSQWLIAARPLPPDLAATLDTVAQGRSGVQQLRLYYGSLLRSNALLTLGGLAVLLLGLSLWLSIALSRWIARPLQKLVSGTEIVAAGDLNHRVEISAPDELGHLVRAFNHMTTRLLASQEDLRRAERIAAWQGVARRLAHEIKNPLTPITLAMHRISGKSDDAVVTECVAAVLEEASNLGRLADEFSLYAQLPKPVGQNMGRAELKELIDGLANFYLARTRVQYQWVGWQDEFSIFVDPDQLRQVLSNLIKNGTEAMAGDGTLTFELETRTETQTAESEKWIELKIRDTGPGLTADPEQIFEPYVTNKETGTGLGLAIARQIINDNGGRLWAESAADGATFTIALPSAG